MNETKQFIHPSAEVSEHAQIGKGTKIWQYCTIFEDVEIGKNCNIGQNVFIESGCRIGNGVKIKNNIALYSGVTIQDDAFIGPNVVFTNVINPRSFIERKKEFRSTIIMKGASLGANSTIICGHVIGKYALIGAGSVVTKDVSDYTLVAGNPARIKGYVCKCGEKLKFENDLAECVVCGERYKISNNKVEEIKKDMVE